MSDFYLPYGRRRKLAPLPDAPAVEARLETVAHPGAASAALANVHVRIPVAARVALVGPNGAGKTTFLKAVAGLLPVQQGELSLYGLPVGAGQQRVAYLPQRSEVDWRFPINVRKLVASGRYVHLGWFKRPGPRDRAMVEATLAQLGLSTLADRQIGQLSGGQQQRALLARALAQEADLLLLDEPLNAVDNDTRLVITRLLNHLHDQGKTVIVATHDLGRLENDFDGAIYLCEGRVVEPPPGSFVGLNLGWSEGTAAWAG